MYSFHLLHNSNKITPSNIISNNSCALCRYQMCMYGMDTFSIFTHGQASWDLLLPNHMHAITILLWQDCTNEGLYHPQWTFYFKTAAKCTCEKVFVVLQMGAQRYVLYIQWEYTQLSGLKTQPNVIMCFCFFQCILFFMLLCFYFRFDWERLELTATPSVMQTSPTPSSGSKWSRHNIWKCISV